MSKLVEGIYYSDLLYFQTDKMEYELYEAIRINASWNLVYNPAYELAYVQIQIFNISDEIKWNSSRYYEVGTFDGTIIRC